MSRAAPPPRLQDIYGAHHPAPSEACSCLFPPSLSPPGQAQISALFMGCWDVFQQPEMNLEDPTGGAAHGRAINRGWGFHLGLFMS